MDQQIAIIGQHPFCLVVAFHAVRHFTGLVFELKTHFVADGLDLALIGASADHKIIGEGGNAGEIEYFDVGGFLGFSGADGNQPGWGFDLQFRGLSDVGFGQITLLSVSYYIMKRAIVRAVSAMVSIEVDSHTGAARLVGLQVGEDHP
jgi:hypothetical protein